MVVLVAMVKTAGEVGGWAFAPDERVSDKPMSIYHDSFRGLNGGLLFSDRVTE